MDSQMRFEARRLLPGMAARLRAVDQVPLSLTTTPIAEHFSCYSLQGCAFAEGLACAFSQGKTCTMCA